MSVLALALALVRLHPTSQLELAELVPGLALRNDCVLQGMALASLSMALAHIARTSRTPPSAALR